jgi:hypothetical protein
LTTIIAIRCKDGVILCADSQSSGSTKEVAVKIEEIGDQGLIACSGYEPYIDQFKDYVRDWIDGKGKKSYRKTLNQAITAFSRDVSERYDTFVPPLRVRYALEDLFPSAIFVTRDTRRVRIYNMETPHPCWEQYYPHRATAGSGSVAADIFLRSGEYLLAKLGLDWNMLSTHLVAQMCWILIRRIAYVDSNTSGVALYRVSVDNPPENLTAKTVFPNQNGRYQLSMLIETAIKEIKEIPNALSSLRKVVADYSQPALSGVAFVLNEEQTRILVEQVLQGMDKLLSAEGKTRPSQ